MKMYCVISADQNSESESQGYSGSEDIISKDTGKASNTKFGSSLGTSTPLKPGSQKVPLGKKSIKKSRYRWRVQYF